MARIPSGMEITITAYVDLDTYARLLHGFLGTLGLLTEPTEEICRWEDDGGPVAREWTHEFRHA